MAPLQLAYSLLVFEIYLAEIIYIYFFSCSMKSADNFDLFRHRNLLFGVLSSGKEFGTCQHNLRKQR